MDAKSVPRTIELLSYFLQNKIDRSWTRCPTVELTDSLMKHNFKNLAVKKDARVLGSFSGIADSTYNYRVFEITFRIGIMVN